MLRVLIGLFLCFFTPIMASLTSGKNYVVVHGKQCTLELYDSSQSLLKVYRVGLGKNGLGKTQEGDLKTPIGDYQLIWKASRFWKVDGGFPIDTGIGYIGADNEYSESPRDDMSTAPICGDDYGGSQAIFMCLDYPNSQDVAKGHTGSGIAIHATLKGGIGEYASRGCVRLSPEDARDLYNKLPVGAKVVIKND